MENRERKEKKLRKKKSCSEREWGVGAGTGSLLCIGKQLPRCSRAPPTKTTLRMGPLKLKTDHQDPTNTALHININSSHQWFSIPFSIRHKKLLIVSRSHAPSGIFFRSCGNFSSLLVVFLSCLWTVCFCFPSLYFNQWMDSIITEVPLAGY